MSLHILNVLCILILRQTINPAAPLPLIAPSRSRATTSSVALNLPAANPMAFAPIPLYPPPPSQYSIPFHAQTPPPFPPATLRPPAMVGEELRSCAALLNSAMGQ
jgi:hypothetical protein